MSAAVVLPTVTAASRTTVRKPVISARTSYWPALSADALKIPKALATTLRTVPITLFLMLMAALARLSHFGGFAQGNLLKFGKTEAKVFTTAKAGWRARFQEVEGYATP